MADQPAEERQCHNCLQQGSLGNANLKRTWPRMLLFSMKNFAAAPWAGQIFLQWQPNKQRISALYIAKIKENLWSLIIVSRSTSSDNYHGLKCFQLFWKMSTVHVVACTYNCHYTWWNYVHWELYSISQVVSIGDILIIIQGVVYSSLVCLYIPPAHMYLQTVYLCISTVLE